MTPHWLSKHADISGSYTVFPDYLDIPPTTGSAYQRVLQVPLVEANILKSDDSVTVTIIAAMDTIYANSYDQDPSFGISDGKNFVGFIAHDHDHFRSVPPCYHVEGQPHDIYNTLTNRIFGSTSNRPLIARSYSSEITMRIKPAEKWGACHTEHDEGHIQIAHYICDIDPSMGLFFQMYRSDALERFRIAYIIVKVELDSKAIN